MQSSLARLIKKIRNEEVVLWAGAGMSLYAGVPSVSTLIEKIIHNAEEDEKQILINRKSSLQDIAEEFIQMRNGSKKELIDIIKEEILKEYKDIHIHEIVTQIPQIKTVITTNYDRLFEQAYGINCEPIIHDQNIPFSKKRNKCKIYKIHGDFMFPESIILSRTDYTQFFSDNQYRLLWDSIKAILLNSTILFVGYSLEDPNIEMLYNRMIDKLGNYKDECFFVAPNLPKYKQSHLAKKKIQYIDMTAEDLFLVIKKEIDRNLLIDCKEGNIDISLANKILRDKGIIANFEVGESIKIKSIKSLDNSLIEGSLKLNDNINNSVQSYFSDLISGKNFGEITFPKGSLVEFKSAIKGVEIPFINDIADMKFTLKSIPYKEFGANLVSKKGGNIIQNVKAKLYKSGYSSQLDLVHKYIFISIKIHLQSEKVTLKYTFESSENVIDGKTAISILNDWINNGDELLVYNSKNKEIFTCIPSIEAEISEELKKNIKFRINILNSLFEIQNYYGVYFILPDKITREDCENIKKITNLVKNIRQDCDNLKALLDVDQSTDFYEYINTNLENTIIVEVRESEKIQLFNCSLEIGKFLVEIIKPYFENIDEIREKFENGSTEIPIVIKSKENEMYCYYANNNT